MSEAQNMTPVILDGREMTSREAAHRHIASVLGFPEWYGRNLDALADCLWETDGNLCVVLTEPEAMLEALGGYGQKIIDIFRENASHKGGCGFAVCGGSDGGDGAEEENT